MPSTPTPRNFMRAARPASPISALDGGRLRFLGGSTNHWGGWCRPLDEIDFESRDWAAPFRLALCARGEIEPYFARAQALVEAGPWLYDKADDAASDSGPMLQLGDRAASIRAGFSSPRRRAACCPPISATAIRDDLKRAARITPLLHANVTGIRLSARCPPSRSSRCRHAVRQPLHGEAPLSRCWRRARWRMHGCCWRPMT